MLCDPESTTHITDSAHARTVACVAYEAGSPLSCSWQGTGGLLGISSPRV